MFAYWFALVEAYELYLKQRLIKRKYLLVYFSMICNFI